VAADNGLIHDELLAVFADVFAGTFQYPLPEISAEHGPAGT
jgi:hypothetical protein